MSARYGAILWRAAAVALTAAALLHAPSAERDGASAQEIDAAFLDRVVASLSVEERIGQLVMVNFIGDDVSPGSDIAGLVSEFKAGAVLVTASNGNVVNRGDTAGQLATLANGLQQRAFDASRRADGESEYFLPLLVATDNEGDLFPFTNVTHNFTQIPNNMTIGATFDKAMAKSAGTIAGRELSAAGINMLLGPVVDVLDNPRSGGAGDIGTRSFGGNAAWAGALGRAYIAGVHEGSAGTMLAVAKHFPGHGGSDRGTDNEVPTVNKSLAQLRDAELVPFAAAARSDDGDASATADAMMVSHIRYRNFVSGSTAPFTRPISIDPAALRTLMELPEFATWRRDHLLMADALGVRALKDWYAEQEGEASFPNRTVAREVLMAGNDLLPLIGFNIDPQNVGWKEYQLPVMQDTIQYLREQYTSDIAFRRRADEAMRHVIAAKMRINPKLALSAALRDPAVASEIAGTGMEEMRALAEAALTLVQPTTVGELRARLGRGPVSPDRVLIVECWADCYPYRVIARSELQDRMLELYGPGGAGRLQAGDVQTISYGELGAWLTAPSDPATEQTARAVIDATWIVFALVEYNPGSWPASAAVKRFLDAPPADLRNKTLAGIAFSSPYHLDSTEISKLDAYIAVYSKTDPAIASALRALFGDIGAPGRSPVDVAGIFYDVNDATQPDPAQTLSVSVFGHDADAVPDGAAIGLVAGPVLDRNGNRVADGTKVSFTLGRPGGTTVTARGETIDGMAGAQASLSGPGAYTASATAGGAASEVLAVIVEAGATPVPTEAPDVAAPDDGGGGTGALVLALIIGVPSAGLAAVAGGAGLLWRRRSRAQAGAVAAEALAETAVPLVESALRVDLDTRRVYVKGVEAQPPLSQEQFRLLSYLYERAGKVVPREELVLHVWPDAHAEGVSEEALDALVRRVRERIAQAGGERSYIVTLRGQGFRLEA